MGFLSFIPSPPLSVTYWFLGLSVFPPLTPVFSAGSLPAALLSFHSRLLSASCMTDTIFRTSISVHLTLCLCRSCTKWVREFISSSRWQPCTVSEDVYLSGKLRTSLPDKIEVTGILGGAFLFLTYSFLGLWMDFSLPCWAIALATEAALGLWDILWWT